MADSIDELLAETAKKGVFGGPGPTGPGPGRFLGLAPGGPTGPSRLPSWESIATDLATMLAGFAVPGKLGIRPILGPLARTGASIGAAGLTSFGFGGKPEQAMGRAALSQLPAEALVGVGRGTLTQSLGKRMITQRAKTEEFNEAFAKALTGTEKQAYEEGLAIQKRQYTADVGAAKTEHAALTEQAETAFQAAKGRYAEEGAKHIATVAGESVPTWKDYPKNTRGLLDIVYGAGPADLSASFDKALKAVVREGRGQHVAIPIEDAQRLGVEPRGAVSRVDARGAPIGEIPTATFVDAGELAEKLPGFWKKDREVYHRGVMALDHIGLGNEAARGEYKRGMAFLEFIDDAQALKRDTGLQPEKLIAAMTRAKKIDDLRKRGMGDVFRGPFAEALDLPAPPVQPTVPPMRTVPEPVIPPEPMPFVKPATSPLGITERQTYGHWGNRILGGALGELAGQAAGHPGVGFLSGAAAGTLLPSTIYGNVPLSPVAGGVARLSPSVLAEILRLLSPGGITPPTLQGPLVPRAPELPTAPSRLPNPDEP